MGYESALQVVGSNISSAGSPDYTRLSPQLDPLQGTPISGTLQPGAGVALTSIQRNIDEALESRVRLAIGAEASIATQELALAQVEILFDDLSGVGIGMRLTQFFNAFDEVQNTPEDSAVRELAITRGAQLANSLRELRARLASLGDDMDSQIAAIVEEADQIARGIANLNEEITTAEAGRRGQVTGLRDQRDGLLRHLSGLFDVTVREQPNGTVNVYIGSEALVQGNSVRGLIAVEEVDGESSRLSVRFADTNQQIDIEGGRLQGLVLSRDQGTQIVALDRLASAVIADVNKIHADGQGLVGFASVTGTNEVLATDESFDGRDAGLAFPPRNGSFYITVADTTTGTPVAYRIDVDLDGTDSGTTLESLVEDINTQVAGVTASITSDLRLQITADDGFTFTFGNDGQQAREDTSGVLAALGINTFFNGSDARNITVNEALVAQPTLLAAAEAFYSGDGTNAGRIATLNTAVNDRLGETSITGFYHTITNAVAVNASGVHSDLLAASGVLESLQAQRESVSGVNLDEEAIALLKYERAFQGAARFVSVVNDLLEELVRLVR